MSPEFHRIALLTSHAADGRRLLATLKAATIMGCHGLSSLVVWVTDDQSFRRNVEETPMDAGDSGDLAKLPPADGEIDRVWFRVRLESSPVGRPKEYDVHVGVFSADSEHRFEEARNFLREGRAAKRGLWINLGSEVKPTWPAGVIDEGIRDGFTALVDDYQLDIDAAALSLCGFEALFANLRRGAPTGVEAPPRGPFAASLNRPLVERCLASVLMNAGHAPMLVNFVEQFACWGEQRRFLKKQRSALVQPVSANGFLVHDSAANVDLQTGRPLLTLDGPIWARTSAASRTTRKPASFPTGDRVYPNFPWVPYCTFDPILGVLTGEPGALGFRASNIVAQALALRRGRSAAQRERLKPGRMPFV